MSSSGIEPLFGRMYQNEGNLTAAMANLVPSEIVAFMVNYGAGVVLAGGFVRSFLDSVRPGDVDLWLIGESEEAVYEFKAIGRDSTTQTENALNIYINDTKVQLINKWRFDNIADLFASFDLSICQAAIYWNRLSGSWDGVCSDLFWNDYSNRLLRYTHPSERVSSTYKSLRRLFRYRRAGYHVANPNDVYTLYQANEMSCSDECMEWWRGHLKVYPGTASVLEEMSKGAKS